ncbi:MAG: response regulator, partial [Nocardioidaceae bacterium]|nr:response regulator [Nocardioidaceae bacterium]
FKVVTTDRCERALIAARTLQPAGLVVGMELGDGDGTSLLRSLKADPETRHLPTLAVHSDDAPDDALVGRHAGAVGVVEPATPERLAAALEDLSGYLARQTRSLLVVSGAGSDDPSAVVALFGAVPEVDLHVATSVAEAADALDARGYDCVVVELKLPGGSGIDVVKRMRSRKALRGIPVVVSTGGELSAKDEARLRQYARSMVVKYPGTDGEVVDEVALFLHRSGVGLPGDPAVVERRAGDGTTFAGKRILIVDDDIRNVFALTSALEQVGIDVVYAENGEAGLQALERDPDIDLVLMDVMMPGMDGYTAMREIRRIPTYRDLPLLALTAKAMPGDRENALAAGASDYVTKPVDLDHLLSRFRAWLP